MVLWAAASALQSGAGRVIVATDDQEIHDRVKLAAMGGPNSLPRYRQASTNAIGPRPNRGLQELPEVRLETFLTDPSHATGTDRLAEVARLSLAADHQIIVNLQGDEPLMPPALLSRVAARLAKDPEAAVATAACPIHELHEVFSPHVVKVVCDQQSRALYFSRAPIPYWRDGWADTTEPGARPSRPSADRAPPPTRPSLYLRHLGLYAYRAGPLKAYSQWAVSPLEEIERLEQLRWLHQGYKIAVEWLADPPPPGVDTPEDLARVQKVLSLGPTAIL